MCKIQRAKGNCNVSGFTLMEVIVSLAIIGISFVMVMQLFSGGLKASRRSCNYTRAVVHAKYKMEEVAFVPDQDSGVFEDGFKWESEIEPYGELEESNFDLVKIKIRVFWDDAGSRQNSVELVSLKTISSEESL
jgi:general secretion pathway protein I